MLAGAEPDHRRFSGSVHREVETAEAAQRQNPASQQERSGVLEGLSIPRPRR
jgi:hypothetical protein